MFAQVIFAAHRAADEHRYHAVTRYPAGHKLSAADYDRGHIGCSCCEYRAAYCEYSRWDLPTRTPTRGVSFFYYCEVCWEEPGPSGSSPKQRALAERKVA